MGSLNKYSKDLWTPNKKKGAKRLLSKSYLSDVGLDAWLGLGNDLGSYLLGSDSVLAWLVGLVLSFIIILQEFRINISEKDKTDENIIDDI